MVTGGCPAPGAGGLQGSAPSGLCHPQGDPGKRGRGEREAKGLFIFAMFYNGIISSQEVLRIDSLRRSFHFCSAATRWECSPWSRALQNPGREKSRACWQDVPGSPRPPYPTHTFCPESSIPASRAAASPGREKALLRKNPLVSPGKPFFSGGSDLSLVPAGTLCPAPGGPFTRAVGRAQASSKALGRIRWEGERGFYKLPFRNGHFEVM